MANRILGVFLHWLPLGASIVIVCGLVYATVQQSYRSGLNDPQVQIAQDITSNLNAGLPLGKYDRQSDIDKSLVPYVIIYDDTGKPLLSSGQLNGEIPVPPAGVFEYTRQNGEDRITWEKAGMRSAIVVMSYKNETSSGFVLVGRNMREVEKRTKRLGEMYAVALLAALAVSFALSFVGDLWKIKRNTSTVV